MCQVYKLSRRILSAQSIDWLVWLIKLSSMILHNQLIDWFVWLINQLIVLAWRVNTATATIASADMDMGYQATMLVVAEISFNTNQLPPK